MVIGRNEGERLARCLRSLRGAEGAVVYVDSGSTDGSPGCARDFGAAVIELDASCPYSAARGRNAGFEALAREHPQLAFIQFVDGDCELVPGWLEAATQHLVAHPGVAVACGRRRELHPEASPWNRLADMEWDTPLGDTDACGGDALVRAVAFREVGGYDASLIAGEEPELCWRLGRAGWRIVRLDCEMTRHDAALERVSQWWRRRARAGHAYAEAVWRHRRAPDPRRVRRLLSILFWAGLVPGAALLLLLPTRGASALLFAGWAWPFWRAYRDVRPRWQRRHAALWAATCVIGKLAELEGAAAFVWSRAVRRRATDLIEYKAPAASTRRGGPSGS